LSPNKKLLQTNIDALEEGSALLALLKPEQYMLGYKPLFQSTIGAHFRHVLEHYRCFIKQLDTGEFCYDSRERDQLLERDFDYANTTIDDLISSLRDLESRDLDKQCSVLDQQADQPVVSTLSRELLFLQSHTVHHYAIIGAMTRSFGTQPAEDFGVAIATREHHNSNSESTIGSSPTCAQ